MESKKRTRLSNEERDLRLQHRNAGKEPSNDGLEGELPQQPSQSLSSEPTKLGNKQATSMDSIMCDEI